MTRYYSSKETCLQLGICRKTLQTLANNSKINFIRTDGGWRKYDLDNYLQENNLLEKLKVCYCRVSTHEQKQDLDRQVSYLMYKYSGYEIIKDIGSGINFKRKCFFEITRLCN